MLFTKLARVVWAAGVFALQASASEPAVESIHYQASLSGRVMSPDDAVDNETSQFYGIGGEVTLPLGHYFGAALLAGYEKSDRVSYPGIDLEGETLYGAAGIFARDPSLGRIGLSYNRSKFDYTATFTYYPYYVGQQVSDSVDISALTLMAELYSDQVTAGFTQTRSEIGDASDPDNFTTAFARWYITDDIRADVEGSLNSDDSESFVIDVEYQPEFLGSSTSFLLGYVHASDEQGIRLAMTFYFGNRFDLKTRDRHYR